MCDAEAYLREEVKLGRVMGAFHPGEFPQVQVNRFSVIPKSTPGKWRLIIDLLYPTSMSVNDGIILLTAVHICREGCYGCVRM